jgi:hypothetical protein
MHHVLIFCLFHTFTMNDGLPLLIRLLVFTDVVWVPRLAD